jgi:hypothetical protein
MTKKDFVLIAKVVFAEQDFVVRSRTAMRFADALATTNPRFDKDRFLNACIDGTGLGGKRPERLPSGLGIER